MPEFMLLISALCHANHNHDGGGVPFSSTNSVPDTVVRALFIITHLFLSPSSSYRGGN